MAHWSLPRHGDRLVRLARLFTDSTERKIFAVMDLVVFLPLLLVMGAFMFFASRRQRKQMQATIDLHNSLKVGDLVHTTSGLRGTIARIDDDNVDLEIAPGVVTTWMKLAVRDRVEPAEDAAEATDELTAASTEEGTPKTEG
jgi:preprotein translocase subunit YajC